MTRKIVAELVLSPRSTEIGISKPLKEVINLLITNKDLKIEIHAMGTNIECNSLDILFDAIKECHEFLIERFPRVVTSIKIDERTDKNQHSLQSKKESIY